MKKAAGIIIIIILTISILQVGVIAASPTFSLTGPGTVRAGDNIKVFVNLNGSGILVAMGKITYDPAKLTYNSTADNLKDWDVSIEQSTGSIVFFVEDKVFEAPINSNKTLFSINFTVKSTAGTGDTISITTNDLSVGTIDDEYNPANVTYSKSVTQPLSSNNNLSSLIIVNADFTPEFSSDTTTYSATVPFTVSSLDITANRQDSKSSFQISQNSLDVGENKVFITVTAENGAKKTYTINVTREQDPNYVESVDGKLKSIMPNKGILSPQFDPDTNLYYVYLPFEIETFNATGEVRDARAAGVESQEISLDVGENEFKIVGTAEDGTKEEYKIIAVRMPKVGEEISGLDVTIIPTQETPSEEEPSEESSLSEDISASTDTKDSKTGLPIWSVVFIAIATASGGFLIGKIQTRKISNPSKRA